jgi:glycosyltransferase involved in cell wall biosynthesis
MTEKKHILVFSLMYHPLIGGAEVAVREITKRLPDYHFHIVTLRHSAAHPVQEEDTNATIYRVKSFGPAGARSLKQVLYIALAQRVAAKIHKKHPIAAVWSIMASYAGFAGHIFTRRYDLPFILTLQEYQTPEMLRHQFRMVFPWFKRIFADADQIQTISHYLKEFAVSMGAKCPVTVVPNGVNYAHFSKPQNLPPQAAPLFKKTPPELILITTSRLVEKNGIEDVINALPKIVPHVRFVIVGDGPLRYALERHVDRLKLRTRVTFLGEQPHALLPAYLQASDIFIRPSLSEGFGNSFVEAMAASLPVVATNVGGIKDFLVHDETGVVVTPHDPNSIADAVNRLANDQALRFRLVQHASAMVREHYNWDRIAEEIKTQVFARVGA